MEHIYTQIPCYENGVEALYTTNEKNVLYNAARMSNELINEWNTNVAFITLADNTTSMKRRIRNRSKVAKFYAVKTEEPCLDGVIRQVENLANTKFVRAFFIYGLPSETYETGKDRLEQVSTSLRSYILLLSVVEQRFFDEGRAKKES